MTPGADVLQAVVRELERLPVRWAVVGGLAISAHVEPRFTRDLDVATAVADDREAERIVRRLLDRGYRVSALVEQQATKRLATVRLAAPDPNAYLTVDLLFASSGIEPEVARAAMVLDIVPGLAVPVAAGLWWPVPGAWSSQAVLGVDVMTTPPNKANLADGHSVALVGYFKNPAFDGGGYFIFRNSWGATWGDQGHGYMPFAYVLAYANDLLAYPP